MPPDRVGLPQENLGRTDPIFVPIDFVRPVSRELGSDCILRGVPYLALRSDNHLLARRFNRSREMKTVKFIALAFAVVFLLGIGWLSYSTLTQSEFLQSDGEQTRAAVLNRIPLGTAITRAAEIMKSEGFECVRTHSTFADDTPSGKQISHPAADILYCNHEHVTWWPISKRWQIILVEENAVVSKVAVGIGLTGP